MKFTKNQFIWLVVLFFSCFLIYTYWETVVSICNKIFVASQPFLFGAGIAFVVNILMSFYEKILIKFIPFGFITKIKRPVSLLLAFATIGLIFTWVVFTVLPDLIDSINTLISQDRSAINNLINWLLKNKSLQKIIQDLGGVTQVRELINSYSAQLLQQIMNGLTNFLTSLTSLPSTLINLLMRFYEVDSGAIYLDGVSIADYSVEELRQQIGMVLQETWLKVGTIHDNIAYGNPEATREEVIAAAKAANADFFIRQLPNGYDTYLSDAGASLSQGQRQLLTIARIFVKLPKILILDEATSSIDTRTEILVQEAFEKLMKGRTSFIIAHRLSTIQSADCILVMVDGDIVEYGTHDELMTKQGVYYQMQTAQAG